MKQEMDAKNLIKFILGTLFGVFFVLVPFNFDGTVDTILFYYVKLFVKQFNSQLSMVLMICIIASAAISLFNLFNDKTFLGQNRLMKKLFNIPFLCCKQNHWCCVNCYDLFSDWTKLPYFSRYRRIYAVISNTACSDRTIHVIIPDIYSGIWRNGVFRRIYW